MTVQVKQKKVFETSDGTQFDDRDDALQHDALVQCSSIINKYLESSLAKSKPRFVYSVRRHLEAYVKFAAIATMPDCEDQQDVVDCESETEKENK